MIKLKVDLEKELKRKIQTWGNGKGKNTRAHTHTLVWVGGRQIEVQILSGKDRVVKYNGKIYGTDLVWKDERAKDSFDILSPDDRTEE